MITSQFFMGENQSNFYNISLEVDKRSTAMFIDLSSHISSFGASSYKLDGINFFPHISLFCLDLSEDGVLKAKNELTKISATRKPIVTTTGSFFLWARGHFIVSLLNQDSIQEVHEETVYRLEGLRAKAIPDRYLDTRQFTTRQAQYISQYGFPFIFEEFIPHFTLTRFDEKDIIIKEPEVIPFEVVISGISLNSVNNNRAKQIDYFEFEQ